MAYSIGLDCGITSVGWAVMELDENEEPKRIIKLGSRIFTAAENPKDGSPLAAPRREARGSRRRLRRHRHRLERIRRMIVNENILSQEELDHLYDEPVSDIYELRTRALDNPVTDKEFTRILINLAQRRGFRSNRKADKDSDESGKLLTAVNANRELMTEHDYRTVGEMMFKDEKFSQYKRNKSENYSNTVSRAMIEQEAKSIFESQRKLKKGFASDKIENEYLDILLSQRAFDEGPGGDSIYGGNQIEKMIGKCTFFPDEKRAAKATYSFQLFTLLQNINHIKINQNGSVRTLTDAERKTIRDLAFTTESLDYSKLRKKLGLSESDFFASLNYGDNEFEDIEKKSKFQYMKAYHKMRLAFDKLNKGYITNVSPEKLNAIGYALTAFKTDDKILEALKDKGLTKEETDAVLTMPSFAKFGHISVKACDMIIPYLEKGLTYDKACEQAGFAFRAHEGNERSKYLPADKEYFEDITNPVVKRAVSQTIKVINAIIREQKISPVYINIELAREMSKTFEERNKDTKSNEENRARNEKFKQEIIDNFHVSEPTGMDIVKLKLWHEQCEGISPYSVKQIEYDRLFEVGYVDIDHIVPYSISFDDSYKNKILVFSSENREKGNRLPLQYLSESDGEKMTVWVENNIHDLRKRQKLLKKTVTEDEINEFKERNLNDTKYLCKFLLNFIKDNLEFAPSVRDKKKRVTAVNGAVTAYMRKRWGITKIREDGDLHHAADAAVIACVRDGMINRISRYSKYHECAYVKSENGDYAVNKQTGEVIDHFPYPYPDFRNELDIRLFDNPEHMHNALRKLKNYSDIDIENIKPCFVSRMPTHKVTGAAHLETVRSPKELDDGWAVTKTPLTSLKLKDGEIADYYNPGSDRLLYDALVKRLAEFDGNGAKAFKNYEMHKPRADGSEGPVVKKVKTRKKTSMNVSVYGGNGIADNDSMVRIDIFYVEGDGYYFVPVYVADTMKKELPNKASVQGKAYSDWKDMSDDNFLFSVYPNDLIRVTAKKNLKLSCTFEDSTLAKTVESNDLFFYYITSNIHTAAIMVIINDNSYEIGGMGIKTLKSIEKYQVDVLGNYFKVGKEKRQKFN